MMRSLLLLTSTLLLAACASAPRPAPVQTAAAPVEVQQRGDLIGLTGAELGAKFGAPGFQVREGPGLKLQWTTSACVLDAYLYPPAGGGGEKVAHVDTRRPGSGERTDQAACIAALDAAG
jgi:outer membrane biogenesis lipoprotein LolB